MTVVGYTSQVEFMLFNKSKVDANGQSSDDCQQSNQIIAPRRSSYQNRRLKLTELIALAVYSQLEFNTDNKAICFIYDLIQCLMDRFFHSLTLSFYFRQFLLSTVVTYLFR